MQIPSFSTVVRKSLASHSWIGIVVGGLMYLLCLSGTIVVFYQELERWEQPTVEEFAHFDATLLENAAAHVLANTSGKPDHVWIALPTSAMPRASVSTDAGPDAWFLNADGQVGDPVAHDWTHLLANLHIYLHLPETLGLTVVGILGALLVGLVISGFLAYPGVFRDAFRWRVGGSTHLGQVDLHNRLSVWGAPFHLMIGITGAFFGLATVIAFVLAAAFHEGDLEAMYAEVYGPEPEVTASVDTVNFAAALEAFRALEPDSPLPSFATMHAAGTPKQFIEFEIRRPGRLLWADYHRFDATGAYLGPANYAAGSSGLQVVYSTYRLHFGHFGGWPVKVLWAVLGLTLTVVSATGINIWLARRRIRDYLNDLWAGTVWGAPAALAMTGVTEVLMNVPSTGLFWIVFGATLAWALWLREPAVARRRLCAATAILVGLLVVGHLTLFGLDGVTPAAWWVNGGLIGVAIVVTAIAIRTPESTRRNPPGEVASGVAAAPHMPRPRA